MKSQITILPSILTANPHEVRELMGKTEGHFDRVHIDILDGVYADNQTIDPSAMEEINTSALIDFHLMVDEPINWMEKCIRAGADRVVAQIEMMGNQREFVEALSETGISIGLALDIDSQPHELDESLLDSLDNILVMSVPAGFGGQEFRDEALEKIKFLDELRKQNAYDYTISCDGGIVPEKVSELYVLGVDEIIVGRRVIEGDIKENIKNFTSVLR